MQATCKYTETSLCPC